MRRMCPVWSRWLMLAVFFALAFPTWLDHSAHAQQTRRKRIRVSQNVGAPTLKDALEKGLRARRPVEFAFVAQVVAAVEMGVLPLDVVNSAFLWARQTHPRLPFPYFQRALIVLAARRGIRL